MRKETAIYYLSLLFFFVAIMDTVAQEATGPIRWNPMPPKYAPAAFLTTYSKAQRTTSASLPFFDDFTDYSPYPNSNWTDSQVYINNTMCVSPVSRGVATFDDLNKHGLPYDSFSNTDFRYADSLTSIPIDLSTHSPADSLYLSFYLQPQGNGFAPLPQDSFIVFMKISFGDWVNVMEIPGPASTALVQPFRQVMIPITNPLFFFDSFQVRFVNIAALNWADANWNLDDVYLNANRNMYDTGINDVAFTNDPTFILNDYSFMPYRQFIANPAGELASFIADSIRNNTPNVYADSVFFSSYNTATGTSLINATPAYSMLNNYGTQSVTTPLSGYNPPPLGGIYDKVTFQDTYYMQYLGFGSAINDTIVKEQVFDNYLAYDDGTAEQSYYLNLFPTEPGLLAIDYHLTIPDTMQGVAIYFARQIPFPTFKTFDFFIYSSINGVNGGTADDTLFEEDGFLPSYIDTVNHFWIYKLYRPVPLKAGTFYTVIRQPAESADDSLYYGLDVNRIGANHRYFNVDGTWQPSAINGAVMVRPLLGQQVTSSGVKKVETFFKEWEVSPQPAKDQITFHFTGDGSAEYTIANMLGVIVQKGMVLNGQNINIASLLPGVYIVGITTNGSNGIPKKIIKL